MVIERLKDDPNIIDDLDSDADNECNTNSFTENLMTVTHNRSEYNAAIVLVSQKC